MRFLKTLNGRLTFAYAAALFVGLCLFAAVSAFFLVQLSAAVLDARLRATATALTAIAVDSGNGLTLDPGDAEQFARVVSTRLDGVLVRNDGTVVTTTTAGVPPEPRRLAASPPADLAPRTIAAAQDHLRVVVWRGDQSGRRGEGRAAR